MKSVYRPLMNIMVIGDTHGDIKLALEMYIRLSDICRLDIIAHCGDLERDAKRLAEALSGVYIGRGASIDRLCYMAREQSCRAVCYGHTHAANITKSGDVRLINPGSLTRLRLGSGAGCALLAETNGALSAALIKY